MASLTQRDIDDILKLFEYELSMLIRMDRFEKMELRRRITAVVVPTLEMDIRKSDILMDVMEDKLHDVFDVFLDGNNSIIVDRYNCSAPK